MATSKSKKKRPVKRAKTAKRSSARNPSTMSPGRKRLFKKASSLPGEYGAGRPGHRLATVRAEQLLDEAERVGAVSVRYSESEYPDTSWMDAGMLKDFEKGKYEFIDTQLVDETTGRVIGGLYESSVGKKASDRRYLHNIALELVIEHKKDVIAAIKRALREDR